MDRLPYALAMILLFHYFAICHDLDLWKAILNLGTSLSDTTCCGDVLTGRGAGLRLLLVGLCMLLASCASFIPSSNYEPPTMELPGPGNPDVSPTIFYDALDSAYEIVLADMEEWNTIELGTFRGQYSSNPSQFLLDVRSTDEVNRHGYIPGAVNIPLRNLSTPESIALLPDFSSPIIAYCDSGLRCATALIILEVLGWEDVSCLGGAGFGDWVMAGFPIAKGMPEGTELNSVQPDPALITFLDLQLRAIPEDFGKVNAVTIASEIDNNAIMHLIDVRTAAERESQGWVEGSQHVPLREIVVRRSSWPVDLDADIVIFGPDAYRSAIAMEILRTYGYTRIRYLEDGINDLAFAGFRIIGDDRYLAAAFIPLVAELIRDITVTPDELVELLRADETHFLLDVRTPSELEDEGYIKGAVNIPLDQLADMESIDLLPGLDTPIVAYCSDGRRCMIALTALRVLGFTRVKCMTDGSYDQWRSAGKEIQRGFPGSTSLALAAPDEKARQAVEKVLDRLPIPYGMVGPKQLAEEISGGQFLVLMDVRSPRELMSGVIEGMIHIPFSTFMTRMYKWPTDKATPIVIYCSNDIRSTIAMTILWFHGYTNVRTLMGGLSNYVRQGFPVAEYQPASQ